MRVGNRDVLIGGETHRMGQQAFDPIGVDPHTVVIADVESVNRGFSKQDEEELIRIFNTAMRDAANKSPDEATRIRDAALLKARPQPEFHANAAAASVVLVVLTLTLNAIAIAIRYRARKSIKW